MPIFTLDHHMHNSLTRQITNSTLNVDSIFFSKNEWIPWKDIHIESTFDGFSLKQMLNTSPKDGVLTNFTLGRYLLTDLLR